MKGVATFFITSLVIVVENLNKIFYFDRQVSGEK